MGCCVCVPETKENKSEPIQNENVTKDKKHVRQMTYIWCTGSDKPPTRNLTNEEYDQLFAMAENRDVIQE